MERDKALAGGLVLLLILMILFFFASGTEGACSGDADCPEGEICGPEGVCTLGGGNLGSPCTNDEDCLEGICIDGFCSEPPEDGSCTTSADCPEGQECVGGFCFEEEPPEGSCSSDADCPEGECIDGVCEEVPEEDTCESDMDCESGLCDEETGICIETTECEGDLTCEGIGDCISPQTCVGGCCVIDPDLVGPFPTLCEEPCEDAGDCTTLGEICVDNCCVSQTITIPGVFGFTSGEDSRIMTSYCDGCPQEDSLVTMMFLGLNLEGKEVSNTLVAEMDDQSRETVEDATVFITITASDLSSIEYCRTLTDASGTARYNYTENAVCADLGCNIKFTFCCADVSEGCLLPTCLGEESAVEVYTDVPQCEVGLVGTWPEQAKIDGSTTLGGEPIYLYPAISDVNIPPEPKALGGVFAFELCLPVLIIFGLLAAAMFVSGRNPLQMFSLYNPRFKRAPQRALRARGMNWNINSIAGSLMSAAQGVGKNSEGRTLKDKAKGLKGMKGKMKGIKKQGRAIKKGGKVETVVQRPKAAEGAGGPAAQETTGGQHGAGASRGFVDTAPGGGSDILKIGAHTGFGGFLKAFGAVFADAVVAKLLTGSGVTSWIVYGFSPMKISRNEEGKLVATNGEGTSGILGAFKDKAEASYAPTLATEMALLETKIGWEQTPQGVDENGNKLVTVTFTDMGAEGGPTRVTETMTEAEAAVLKEQIVVPVMMLEAGAAQTAADTGMEVGSPQHEAIETTIEEGAPIYGVDAEGEPISAIDAKVELGPGASPEDVPGIILAAESLETSTGEKITDASAVTQYVDQLETRAQNVSANPEARERAEAGIVEVMAQQAKGEITAEQAQRKIDDLQGTIVKLDAQMAEGTMTPRELQAAVEVFRKASDGLGAEAVAQDPNLSQLANAIVVGSAGLADNAPAGTEKGDALGLAMYSQAVVADTGIEAGREGRGMANQAMGALGETYEEANQMVLNQERGVTGTLSDMTSNFSEAEPSSTADFQQIANQINSELREFEKFQVQEGIDPHGTSATAEYLLKSGQFQPPADYSQEQGDQTPGAHREQAAREEMVRSMNPSYAARTFVPEKGTVSDLGGPANQRNNAEAYQAHVQSAADAAAYTIANKELDSMLTPENVSRHAPVDLTDARAVEAFVKPLVQADPGTPEYREQMNQEVQRVYDSYAPGANVKYDQILEQSQKPVEPVREALAQNAPNTLEEYGAQDKEFQKLREMIDSNLGADASRPASPPSDGRVGGLNRLYMAMDASGDDSRMNDSNRRAMERIAKDRQKAEKAVRKSMTESDSESQIRAAAAQHYVQNYDAMEDAKTAQLKRKMDRDFDDLAAGRPQQKTWQEEQAKKQKEKEADMTAQRDQMLKRSERLEAAAAGREAAEKALKQREDRLAKLREFEKKQRDKKKKG